MDVRHFRWVFLGALAFLFLVMIGNGDGPVNIGASAEWSDGRYAFAGGTGPWALGCSVLLMALYVGLMCGKPMDGGVPLPTLFRRFGAFWLDFVFSMVLLLPMIGILATTVEWRRTGVFAWHYTRTTWQPSDLPLVWVSLALLSPLMLLYHAIPLHRRRPSPGSCIAGYQILTDDGQTITLRRAVLRALLGFATLCAWPVAWLLPRDRMHGKFSHDIVFKTRATLLR